MGNGTSSHLISQDPRRNIWRKEKFPKYVPEDKLHLEEILQKQKQLILSKKDYCVAKLKLRGSGHIPYCQLTPELESEQAEFTRQTWEVINPAFVEYSDL